MKWVFADDIKSEITVLIKKLDFRYIDPERIICFRSYGSTSRARARIWSFPQVWQLALAIPPHYVIEVLSCNFDKLSSDEQKRVLIHELLHIPKNFSGNLLSHKTGTYRIDSRKVNKLFRKL